MNPVQSLLFAKILHARYELVRKRSLEHNRWPNASSALEMEREHVCEREGKGIKRLAEAPPHWHRSMIHTTAHHKPANEVLSVVATAAASEYTIPLFSPRPSAPSSLFCFVFLPAWVRGHLWCLPNSKSPSMQWIKVTLTQPSANGVYIWNVILI